MMRLLEVDSNGAFILTEFTEDELPPYAILSHTWGPDHEEVTFKDMFDLAKCGKVGLQKLRFCANEVAKDGLKYFWIDTCAIDKSSSTELSEAINSMFQWYQNATKCYVFLTDVSTNDGEGQSVDSQLRASRWFTRGWTLQELLAPKSVEFFSREGERLGTKVSLQQQIHQITGIAIAALQGHPLSEFSIAERISWKKNRDTKRKEDKAYSLLGIFGVHLPLIYGEGEQNAFRRLHEEIKKHSTKGASENDIGVDSVQISEDEPECEDREKIIDWVSTEDYEQKHRAIRLPRVLGTGRWLLENEEYLLWRDGRNFQDILWCHGLEGTGKSVLTSLVIDQLRDSHIATNQALAFIYFDYRDDRNQDPARIVANILRQLLSCLAKIPSDVAQFYQEKQRSKEPSLLELNKLLLSVLKPLERFFLVIDALDECEAQNRRELLSILKNLGELQNVRIFVTSRPYPSDIQAAFGGASKITIQAQNYDIRLYVQEQLKNTFDAGMIDNEFMEDIIKKLLDGSQGLFLLATLQVRTILNEPTPGDMEDALANLSGNLAEAFAETINRIKRLPESRRRLALTTLLWTCHAKSLLTASELLDALAVRPGQSTMNPKYRPSIGIILECCQGLVTVEPETGFMRFAHYSIQEYLVERSELFERGHAKIAETCLTYLMFTEFQSGPCLNETAMEARMAMHPFLFFAATQGFDHVGLALPDPLVESLLWKLFASQLALASSHQAKRFGKGFRDIYWAAEECLTTTPLHFVASYGYTDIARKLLQNPNTVPDAATNIGTTPLIMASSKGHVEIMQLLRKRGASPYRSNWYGNSLHCAAEAGNCEAIKLLVSWGVDPNIRGKCVCGPFQNMQSKSKCGRTPLTCTFDNDHAQAAETLLQCGANIRAPNCYGRSFFVVALFCNAFNVIKMLLAKNHVHVNDILQNTVTNEYTTALHLAAEIHDDSLIEFLLRSGANPTVKDSRGFIPLQYIHPSMKATSLLLSYTMAHNADLA